MLNIILQYKYINTTGSSRNTTMTFISSDILIGLGQGLSITGLVLAMPFCFAFRHYLRFLDHLQFIYVYASILASSDLLFGNNLSNSWVAWDKNIFFFCSSGQFVCIAGFPLSFGACLLIFLLVMRIIVAIETCRKKQLRFQPVYTFFKGLTRWIYAPLSYWSIYYLIKSIKGQSDSIISSVVIVAICVIFPIAQLVGYKLIQSDKDDIWRKWLQFANFVRILLICGFMAIGIVLGNQLPYYFVYGAYLVYGVLFIIKNNFLFKIVGRIIFGIGQAMMIAVFSLFLFKKQFVFDFHLDFILVSVLFLMDLVYYIIQLITYYRKGVPPQTQNQKVYPQPSQQKVKRNKKNSYQIDLNDNDNQFNNSRQEINIKQIPSPTFKNNKSINSPQKRR